MNSPVGHKLSGMAGLPLNPEVKIIHFENIAENDNQVQCKACMKY